MADIFFGKFSELVSKERDVEKIKEEKKPDIKTIPEKKSQNKILIYFSIGILTVIAIYLLIWVA